MVINQLPKFLKQIIMATPTITGYSTQLGSGFSISIAGTNEDGLITVTTGSSPTAPGGICTVSLTGLSYPTSCIPVISPANVTTSTIMANINLPGSVAAAWDLHTNVKLAGSTTYMWNYHCGGY